MVVDSSAFVAIIIGEAERHDFSEAILAGPTRRASAATLLETSLVVLARKGEAGLVELRDFIDSTRIEIVPFTAEQLVIAVDSFRRFGKGRHPAALNLGDCFSYALANAAGEPLLFKGDDFSRTDIQPAM